MMGWEKWSGCLIFAVVYVLLLCNLQASLIAPGKDTVLFGGEVLNGFLRKYYKVLKIK